MEKYKAEFGLDGQLTFAAVQESIAREMQKQGLDDVEGDDDDDGAKAAKRQQIRARQKALEAAWHNVASPELARLRARDNMDAHDEYIARRAREKDEERKNRMKMEQILIQEQKERYSKACPPLQCSAPF